MTDCILFIPGTNKPRHVPPPLPPDGGGWWYLKRTSDGAILLSNDGYVQFDEDWQARAYAAENVSDQVDVCFMPKMRAN